jgi:hypothetical protein
MGGTESTVAGFVTKAVPNAAEAKETIAVLNANGITAVTDVLALSQADMTELKLSDGTSHVTRRTARHTSHAHAQARSSLLC